MADMTVPGGLVPWADYPRFARRHLRVLGSLMALGLIVGVGWSLDRPASYSATTSLVLAPVPKYVTPPDAGLVPPEVSIDTDAQLLRSRPVLVAVAGALGTDREEAGRRISVTASPNSHVLHVTVTAASAQVAAEAADAAAAALVRVRRHMLGSLGGDQLRQLRMLIVHEEQQLAQDQAAAVVIPALDDAHARIVALKEELGELELARSHPVEASRTALVPRHADYANTEVPLVSGVMVGLLCGCLVGAVRDRTARGAARPPVLQPSRNPLDATTHHEDRHAV